MKKRQGSPPRWVGEIAGVLLLLAAALLFLGLASHHPEDPSWGALPGAQGQPTRNLIGPVGANLSYLLFQVLGFGSFLLPIFLGGYAIQLFGAFEIKARVSRIVGGILLLVGGCSLLTLAFPAGLPLWGGLRVPAGGFVGDVLAGVLKAGLNPMGAYLLTVSLLALSLILAMQVSLAETAVWLHGGFRALARTAGALWADWREEHARKEKERKAKAAERLKLQAIEDRKRAEEKRRKEADRIAREKKAAEEAARAKAKAEEERKASAAKAAAEAVRKAVEARTPAEKPTPAETPAAASPPTPPPGPKAPPPALPPVGAGSTSEIPVVHARKDTPPPTGKAHVSPVVTHRTRPFALPDLSLLDRPSAAQKVDETELLENSQRIVAKFQEFGVGGKVLQIHPGPVVTTYEFKPDAGIKISRIISLADDLSMALQAESIRIDRLPGKPTVGIEVPNRRRETIALRELLESEPYRSASSKLTLIIGKSIEGEPYVADLAKMPHLLVAGATGSGKSVALNAMIASILYKASPEEVKFILIDPKMLEMGLYKDTPHLYAPVVTDARIAANALKWAVCEMENRYKALALSGVRNIDQYNAHVRAEARKLASQGVEPDRPLPYLLIIVDELADLILVAGSEVEDALARLAQMARAVGIHLILATQRPSVDVITGVIKANFPARISFRVSSKVDSRTILDGNGAETLLGKGDMLYLPPGSARIHRLHAPLLTEREINSIVEHLKAQGAPEYDQEVLAPPSGSRSRDAEGDEDELFDEAARIVVQRQEASVSYLQRRLKIGYARAARLVDMMERDGIVAAPDGSKVRQVLVGSEYFAEVDHSLR